MSVSDTGVLPRTAAVSAENYKRCFEGYISQGYELVHINISGEMSSGYVTACLAGNELDGGVYPVDSRSLSTGSGHLALMAAELAREGLGGAEIAERLNEAAERLEVSFVVDTVDYPKNGSRREHTQAAPLYRGR